MKEPAKAIICGTCRVAIKDIFDPKPNDEISCPQCGARDSFEVAMKIAFQHIEYRLHAAGKEDVANFRRNIGLSVSDNQPNGAQEPFFKWRVKS